MKDKDISLGEFVPMQKYTELYRSRGRII